MNFYTLLRRLTAIRSPRIRLLLFGGALMLRRRAIGVYIDPTIGCNLRCAMCAFSSAKERAGRLKGRMTDEAIAALPSALLPYALKLQIGCGAEPTIDPRTTRIIAAGKEAGVPYISVTTNGQLLTPELLESYIEAGLHEVTVSLHGVKPETYERLMPGASHRKFLQLIATLREAKKRHSSLRVRVNFTVNADNLFELPLIPQLFGQGVIDILQLRPVQNLGDSAYTNFDLTPVVDNYAVTFGVLRERASQMGITCLMPERNDIMRAQQAPTALETLFESLTYCYTGPEGAYSGKMPLPGNDYRTFHRRRHTLRRILRALVSRNSLSRTNVTRKLNYRL